MPRLDIKIREQDEVVVMSLSGSADMSEISRLNRQLEGLFVEGRKQVVLELLGLEFASSMALGAMIRTYTRCRERGGRLVLVGPQDALRQVLRTTRLDELFQFAETVEEGIVLAQQPPGEEESGG